MTIYTVLYIIQYSVQFIQQLYCTVINLPQLLLRSVAEPELVKTKLFQTWSRSRKYFLNKYLI